MEDRKESECDFALKGLGFRYQKNFKAFMCDQQEMLTILQHNYPASYEEIVAKYPELQVAPSLPSREENAPGDNTLVKLKGWRETNFKEMKDATVQVKDGRHVEDATLAGKKPGMISRLSKGIKKFITTITPKKLRRSFHLEDEEALKAEEAEDQEKEPTNGAMH